LANNDLPDRAGRDAGSAEPDPLDIAGSGDEPALSPSTRDATRIDDLRIDAVRPLISPALLHEDLPAPPAVRDLVARTRVAIAEVLNGHDDRLLVVVGPCSIHDHDEALEYATHLKVAADGLGGELIVVMRTYFEKPRTTVGW
jgi:3-deoxy-7-phosphoheptulonate synthase